VIQEGVRPADLQDGAEKRVQSLPYSTAHIEAQQSGAALFPEEEPGCIVPPGTADNSPPFQRWDKRWFIVPASPGGTAEALSEDVFQPSLRDWIWKKGRAFPPQKRWAGEAVEDFVRCPSGTWNAICFLQNGGLHPKRGR